ncbi:hypothetical protein [Emticicia sp. 17c]|uniref:hypothetical protein n=1 Tax=Emticicia sp. 17c TaxID=3127704 RepID=UPI00301D420F
MASKGVDFYAFVAEGYEIEIRKADAGKKDNPDVQHIHGSGPLRLFSEHYELYPKIFPPYYEGKFQFYARKDGKELFERSIRVNTLTGNIESDDITNIRIPSIVADNYSLSFGLYDADNTNPSSHQLYATLTPNRSNWMTQLLAKAKSKNISLENLSLSKLFLPGSHDAGMYTDVLLEVSNLANTQRDDIATQLALGARYFDFRPGKVTGEFVQFMLEARHNPDVLSNTIAKFLSGAALTLVELLFKSKLNEIIVYFQSKISQTSHIHAVIPGESYAGFIKNIVNFLSKEANKHEIVVINIATSGIVTEFEIPNIDKTEIRINGQDMRGKKLKLIEIPTREQLSDEIASIVHDAGIKVGNKASLKKNLQALINDNERLIILNEPVSCADTYSDDYESYDSQVITHEVKKVLGSSNTNDDLVKLQLQLTATGTKHGYGGIIRALKGGNKSTSPLYATKPATDLQSYQLLLNSLDQIKAQQALVVAQNDFYDNALTEVAVVINEHKLGLK